MARLISRTRRAPALAAALFMAAFGLAGCSEYGDTTAKDVNGAVLSADRTAVVAGQSVTLNAVGSQLETSGQCPQRLFFFADDSDGAEQEITPQTLDTGDSCKVSAGAATVTMPAGEPGTSRYQTVKVLVEGGDENGALYKSTAEVSIHVQTPGLGGHTTPVSTVPSTQPTTEPTTEPTTHPTTEPTVDPGPHHCATNATPTGQAPVPDFAHNPTLPVATWPTLFDATPSHDPDGTIVQYKWDWNNDGRFDLTSASPTTTFTPQPSPGGWEFCFAVTDDDGNTSYLQAMVPVEDSGAMRAQEFHVSPDSPVAGEQVHFFAADVPEADSFALDADDDFDYEQTQARNGDMLPTFTHTFATPGLKTVRMLYIDADTGSSSFWTRYINVADPAVVTGGLANAAAKKKAHTVTAVLDGSRGKVVDKGRVSYKDGVVSVDGAVVAARSKGKLSRKQLRKLPRKVAGGLKAVYNADFVARFSGRRVVLTPDSWGLAGKGTVLARSRGHKGTRVCLSLTTDGISPAGTRWTVLGATGRAARLSGSGVYAPPVIGKRTGEEAAGVAVVKLGRKRGIGRCASLAKYLPKAKKKKGR